MGTLRGSIRLLLATCLFVICSCSDDEKIKFPGNAELLFEVKEEKNVEGTDMTIKRVRAWRSTPNGDTPGVVNLIDTYTLELWFQLSGEEKPRYGIISNLIADDEFNLYDSSAAPGSKSYRAASTRMTAEEPFSYAVSSENGLMSEEYPVASAWEEVVTAEGTTSTTTQLIKAHEIAESPWASVRYRKVPEGVIASRVRLEENASLAIKGKVGCVVKTPDTSSALTPKTYVFGELELGNVFQDKSGQATSGTAAGLGDDDALWIPWTEYWLVTGGSTKEKKLRFMRVRSAPFFNNRELPGVDVSDTKPKISGMETLVRSCNSAAAKSGGYFSIMSLSSSPLSPNLQLSNTNNYCQSMVDAVAANPDNIRLDTFFPCSFGGLLSTASGTWNGTTHTAPITSAGSNLVHIEQSEIKEIQF